MDGLLLGLGRVLTYCEYLVDFNADTKWDGPGRIWRPADIRAVSLLGRRLLSFAAGKVRPYNVQQKSEKQRYDVAFPVVSAGCQFRVSEEVNWPFTRLPYARTHSKCTAMNRERIMQEVDSCRGAAAQASGVWANVAASVANSEGSISKPGIK